MDDAAHDTTTRASRPLLDGQLRLLETRRRDVEALVERGGGADGVVAGLPPEERRRALEGFEREARKLFRRAAELARARCLPP